jgi:Trk K+ transport system NAD-binding subunit
MTMKIGFIGLGIMGKPMSKNLLEAGNKLIVMDVNDAVTSELRTLGADVGGSPADRSSMEMMQALHSDGFGDDNHCSLVRYYEKIANTAISNLQ